jgi:hypothetical protein
VGNTQHFYFQEGDVGPVWLSEEEKLRQKFDKSVGEE